MARDTAWGRARSAFRRMARPTGRSKARVIPWIARLARGSTALRRARQQLFRLYVRPVVIHDGHHCRTPVRPRSDHKPLQSAHQLWEVVPDIGLRPLAARSSLVPPTRQPVRVSASITPKDNTDLANSVSGLAMALLVFSITHAQGRLSTAEEASPTLYRHEYRHSRTH